MTWVSWHPGGHPDPVPPWAAMPFKNPEDRRKWRASRRQLSLTKHAGKPVAASSVTASLDYEMVTKIADREGWVDRGRYDGVTAQAIPSDTPSRISARDMQRSMSAGPTADRDTRSRFGRSLTLDRVQQAIQAAQAGAMSELCDLAHETIDMDPHLASVLGQRLGALSSCPWDIVAAKGAGVDDTKAAFYATVVREQLALVPGFRQALRQIAWGLFHGRASQEIKWKMTANPYPGSVDGFRWSINGFEWVHPRRLQFGPERELRLYDGYAAGNFVAVGVDLRDYPNQFLSFTPQLFGDYQEREGLAPRCLYWAFFKRFSARERMILVELFGKPWRIIEVDQESTASETDLLEADDLIENLGGSSTARLPRGTKLETVAPSRAAGQIHQETIADCDTQLDYLVLGKTGEDAGERAANLKLTLDSDAVLLSEALEHLCNTVVSLNFGEAEVVNAPKFKVRSEIPVDLLKELDRLDKSLKVGLEIPLDEAYNVSGFRKPLDGESVVRMGPAAGFGGGPMPEIVPAGTPPTSPPEPPAPAPAPEPEPEGPEVDSEPEDGPKVEPASKTVRLQDLATDVQDLLSQDEHGGWILKLDQDRTVQLMSLDRLPMMLEAERLRQEAADLASSPEAFKSFLAAGLDYGQAVQLTVDCEKVAAAAVFHHASEHVCMAKQPATVNGSPEEVINEGVDASAKVMEGWARKFASSVKGKDSPKAILGALNSAAKRLSTKDLEGIAYEQILHGAMLGAMDDAWEIASDDQVKPVTFAATNSPGFAHKSFAQALKDFLARKVVSKKAFEAMKAESKRRAFTVAAAASDRMLFAFRSELARKIAYGGDLRKFSEAIATRADTAGFTPANASHVETIYRTNVATAYSGGRANHATQPEVLEARPYWQVRTVNDGPPRQRSAHKAVHGWVLRADDPFFAKGGLPPWGFNCRCRVSTLSAKKVKADGIKVRKGSEISGLPDEGFESGATSFT